MSIPSIEDLQPTTMPTRQGRRKQENPYVPLVQKSWDDESAYEIVIELEGDTEEDQDKELAKIKGQMQRAGNDTEPAVTVRVAPSEIESDGTVSIKFEAKPKIVRKKADKD